MNLLLLRILTSSLIFFIFATLCLAKVYVYEIATENRRFQTVSKLNPKAYFYYNGGEDVIKKITVLAVYKDNQFKEAMRDYKLEEANTNTLLPKNYPSRNSNSNPFIWWK